MRLSVFILAEMEKILEEWDGFAASMRPAASGMASDALRDHAREILEAVAKDLQKPQTRKQQRLKSRSNAMFEGAPRTAARTHGLLRAQVGFDVNQLVAEFRALRASVLRLWSDQIPMDAGCLNDVVRFNEAIDQAIAESVGHFHQSVERYRNLLLGMLGHDMRSPLQCILLTAKHLNRMNAGEEISEAAESLIRSGASMQALLDDLTDFNRTNLGMGLKISRSAVDLEAIVSEEIHQFRALYPEQKILLNVSGDSCGEWDGGRLRQLFRNLLSNALRHGNPEGSVRVAILGRQSTLRLKVTNHGSVAPSEIRWLFEPLARGSAKDRAESKDGLGLGLFIVREIVRAHGGDVNADSDGERFAVVVRLPRRP
ncbi:MAG: sensor histidine kinase [Terrimicrobiaceae bacterium]|nr:sensor histidine kinase [Terrimicrobiaceae bacterium]